MSPAWRDSRLFVLLPLLVLAFIALHLMFGRAPLIASIIWGYSIYAAVVWTETVSGERYGTRRPPDAS